MATSSDETKRPKRTKAQAAEHALANRVAAALDPTTLGMPMAAPPAPPAPAKRLGASTKPTELLEVGAQRINEVVTSAQEIARETAQSMADSRLQAAQSFVAFQQKVLTMVHDNLSQGFAAAQSLVRAPNVGEAIRVQNQYAQGAVKALSAQAAELRTLSADLARGAGEPWRVQWTKSIDQLRHGLKA
jgi:hypothetical protein